MRTTVFLTLFLTTLPAWAAEPATPPSPPAITWEVWGYKWDGGQWTIQPDHILKTTDLKQAADYEAEIARFQNWTVRSNIPYSCSQVATQPDSPNSNVYVVWAFSLENGTWVKDEKYSWTVPVAHNSRTQALAYAKSVNAVPGWRATTNAPESTRQAVAQPTYQSKGYSRGNYSRSYNSRYDSRDLFGRPANYEDQFNAGATNFWVQPPNPD